MEGIEEDVFDWEDLPMLEFEFTASLGLADAYPVGGPVAGAVEAVFLNEGFEENGAVLVALFPIVRETFGDRGKDAGGEVLGMDPGEDEKAGVVDNQMEVLCALLRVPADEAVAGCDLPGGGSEAEKSHKLPVFTVHKIARLRPRKRFVPEVVVAMNEFVPKG